MKSVVNPFLALLLLAPSVHATAKIWDITPGDGSTITAGSGNWLTDGPNWNTGAGDATWTAGDTATFQAADDLGTHAITVGGAVSTGQTASSLTFSNSGFTLRAAAPQTVGLGTTNADSSIRVEAGKTATIGDSLTVKKAVSPGVLVLLGGGTLNVGSGILNSGAVLQNSGTGISLEMRNGTALDIRPGGSLLCARSVVVGSTVADTNTHRLKVSGGTVTFSNSDSATCNIVIGNNTNGQTSTAIVDITGGELNNQTTGGALRFGPATAGANTNCTATANLDGGILTLGRVFQAAESGGVITSTFSFNGGTLKVLPGTTNASQFMTGLDFAYVKSGGAIIDTNGVTGNGANVVITQPLLDGTGGGGLTKEGIGTLTLTGANTYTGPTVINGGKLAITAPYNAITATTVNNGARLKVNSSGGAPSSLGTVSLNAGSGFEFDLGSFNGANQPALAIGTLNANSNYAIDLSGINIPSGTTITLLTYSSKTGGGTPVIGNLPLGVSLSGPPVDNGSSIQITVSVGSPTSFTWAKGDGDWDTTSLSWNTTPFVAYTEPAVVTFPTLADAVDGINTVNLTSNRAPFSVSITNTGDFDTTAYNFTGTGAITGSTGITKSGAGIARFSTPNNSYTGTLAINAGAVIKDVADNATGNITVASDATFALAGGITDGSGQTVTITGTGYPNLNYFYSGSFNQRGSLQAQTGNNIWAGNIILSGTPGTSGTTRIGVQNGASLTLTGTISEAVAGMSPYFRAGDTSLDVITIAGTCSWTGPTRIFSNGGSVTISASDKLPTTVDLIVGNSAGATGSPTFDLAGFNQTVAGLGGSGGTFPATIKNSGEAQSILTLNPTTASNYPGKVQDNVKLVIGGTASQTLAGDNFHTADTTIKTGANLIISDAGELTFYPGENGVSNSVGGTGTLQYDGTLRIDLSGTDPTPGRSWNLVKVGGLASVTYGATFTVASWYTTFTETTENSGIWKGVYNDVEWTFTQSTGKLSVATYVPQPFDIWIGSYFPGETDPLIIGKNADPDGDGTNNLAEFALNGVPDNGANNGHHVIAVEDTDADMQKELTLTIAVRKAGGSPVFSGSPLSAISDGVKYTIEGSLNLVFPTSAVTSAPPATGPVGLPTGYEYRRFRLDASEGLGGKGFLRVKTETAP
jgi:autotransporter-associated beta strand protein